MDKDKPEDFHQGSFVPTLEKPVSKISCIKSQAYDKFHFVAVA